MSGFGPCRLKIFYRWKEVKVIRNYPNQPKHILQNANWTLGHFSGFYGHSTVPPGEAVFM